MAVFINYRLELTPMEEVTMGNGKVKILPHSSIAQRVIEGRTDPIETWDNVGILNHTFQDETFHSITELLGLQSAVDVNFVAFQLFTEGSTLQISFDGTTPHIEIGWNERGIPLPFANGITTDNLHLKMLTNSGVTEDPEIYIFYQRK